MWFNSDATRRTLPVLDLSTMGLRDQILHFGWVEHRCLHGCRQLVSLRCWVKSRNRSRNPHLQLPPGSGRALWKQTAGDKPEEGGDDVKSSWPLQVGLHTYYNGGDSGLRNRKVKLIPKNHLSSDCTLQLECMKLESLVIADQHAAVNTFPGLVHTAIRHGHGSWFYLKPVG